MRGPLKGCEILRIPHYPYNRLTDGGEVVGLTHRSRSIPTETVFLLLSLVLVSVRELSNPQGVRLRYRVHH
jgi:hypothetical protein